MGGIGGGDRVGEGRVGRNVVGQGRIHPFRGKEGR